MPYTAAYYYLYLMLLSLTLRKEICLVIGYYRVLYAAGGCVAVPLYESKES